MSYRKKFEYFPDSGNDFSIVINKDAVVFLSATEDPNFYFEIRREDFPKVIDFINNGFRENDQELEAIKTLTKTL